MAGLLNQVGAAPFGANNDAAAAEQQALQGDAAPSLNSSQSSDLSGSGSQMQIDLLQEAVPVQGAVGAEGFLVGPVQAQGPTPINSKCSWSINAP